MEKIALLKQTKVSFLSNFASLSITNVSSFQNWVYIAIYLSSQVQIFAILAINFLLILSNETNWFKDILSSFQLISSVGHVWDIDSNHPMTFGALIVISIFLVSEISSVMFLTALSMLRKSFSPVIVKYLKITIDIHYRILFYPVHLIGTSVLSNTLKLKENPLSTETIRVIFLVLVIMGLLWNFIYSMSTLLVFSPKIKTENPLCTHTGMIDCVDLVFKTISPIYWLFNPMASLFDSFLSGIHLIYFLFRDLVLFSYLPYYNIPFLNLATKVHAFLTTFALVIIFSKLITFSETHKSISFLCLMIFLVSPMMVSIYTKHMQKVIVNIPINLSNVKPYYLIHYWDIWRYVSSRSKVPNLLTRKVDEKYIYQHIVRTQSPNIQHDTNALDWKSVALFENQILNIHSDLLRASIKRGSCNDLLTACLARQYLKSEKLYVLADDLIRQGIKSSSMSFKFSFYLMRAKLFQKINNTEKQIFKSGENSNHLKRSAIDNYIKLNDKFETFKRDITEQLQLQTKFWENYQNQEPNCNLLLNLSKEIFYRANKIKQEWVSFGNQIDTQFKFPLLIYGCYLSFVENDLVSGDQLIRQYERLKFYDKDASNSSENKMSIKILSDSVSLTVSGSPKSLWKILDCSHNIKNHLGFSKETILGQSIILLLPSLNLENLQKHFENTIKAGNSDATREICAVDREGYLVLCRIYVTFRFFNNYELSYYIVLNVQKEDNIALVQINGSGEIVNFSRTFAEDIGLSQKEKGLNIFSICPDLKIFRNVSFKNKDSSKQTQPTKKGPILKPAGQFVRYGKARKRIQLVTSTTDATEKLFRFCLPSKNKRHAQVVYKVRLKNSLNEGETLTQIVLTRINNVEKEETNDLEEISESFEDNYKADFISQSLKKDKSLLFTPRSDQISSFSPINRGNPSWPVALTSHNTEIQSLTNQQMSSSRGLIEPIDSFRERGTPKDTFTSYEKTGRSDKLQIHRGDQDENLSEGPTKVVTSKSVEFIMIDDGIKRVSKEREESAKKLHKVSRMFEKKNYCEKKENFSKEFHQALSEKKHKKPVVTYTFLLFFSMVVQVVFLVWLNFKTLEASQEAADINKTLQATLMRTHLVNLANQETRYWVGLSSGFFDGWAFSTEMIIINKTFTKLTKKNQDLVELIKNLPEEIQLLFFEKNINLYERDRENNLRSGAVENSFQVVDKIITHGFRNIYRTTNLSLSSMDFINEDSRFIFDNSPNDFLVVSERLIVILQDEAFNVLVRAKMEMTGFLLVSMVIMAGLVVISVRFVIELDKETEIFIKLFLSLSEREVKEIEGRIVMVSRMIQQNPKNQEGNYKSDPFDLYSKLSKPRVNNHHNSTQSSKILKKSPSRHSLKQIRSRNWISIGELCLILIIIMAFMLVYYFKALYQTSVIEKHQVNMNAALENIKTESSIIAQINALIMDNATTTVRHEPILNSLHQDIRKMQGINDIKERLADENSQLSQRQQEILFNLSCEKAYSPDYVLLESTAIETCNSLSKGSGYLGLVNILSELSNNLVEYVLEFENSNRTMPVLSKLYEKLPSVFNNLHDASMAFLLLSFETTREDYQELISKLENQRTLLGWIAVLVLIVLVGVLWKRVVIRLIQRVFEPQDMLRLVPPKLIYKRPLLKKYVYGIQG